MITARYNLKIMKHLSAYLLITSVYLMGCDRDTSREDLSDPNATLVVVQAMVDDTEVVPLNDAQNTKANLGDSRSSSTPSGLADIDNKSAFIEGDGFDVITSVSTSWKLKEDESTLEAPNPQSYPRAASPMTPGFTYRLVLYKVVGSTQTFWRQKQLRSSTSTAVDTAQQIEVVRGDTYRWYAYSYNNSSDIPPLTNTGTNAQISMGTNSDFLYATGSFTISATGTANTPLNITFRHQVARLAVEVDARGMFADQVTQLGVSVGGITGGQSPLTTGSFGLLDGQVYNPTPYTPTTTFTIADFRNVDVGFNDRKAIYFYSATPASFSNFTVNLNNVTITMTDGPTTRAFTGLNRVFAFNTSAAMTRGRTYNAKIDLIESALPFQGVNWARTNLYLHSSQRNRYRFHATYAHTNMRESYWPFRSTTPYMFSTGAVGANSDPCTLVHPTTRPSDGLSVWRQATRADYSTLGFNDLLLGVLPLVTRAPARSIIYNQTNGRGYYEYATTGSAAQYPSSNLRFNMNGFGTAVNVASGLLVIDIGISNYGTEGRHWSYDRLIDAGGLLGLGAYSLRTRRVTSSLAGAYNLLNPDIVEVLTISLLGGGLLESSFQNVRCVRR